MRKFGFWLVIAGMLLAACGQKPGVHIEQITAGQASSGLQESGDEELGLGGSTTAGGTTTSTGTSGPTGVTAGGTQSGGSSGPTTSSAKVDRTGVTDKEITIGIHAPVTGAAPFPAGSFEAGREVYWKRSNAPLIFGRKVKVLFENDDYNPTTARDRCRKMAEQQKAFLLVGGGGTDQVQACAQYAAQAKLPYLSAGTTEVGVSKLPNYFGVSMSYKQQTSLLWQLINSDSRLKGLKVAMVRTDTPNFDDAHQGFLASKPSGKELVLDKTLPKNPSQNDYSQMAVNLAGADAQVVFILTAPVHYVQLTARLPSNYRPWWVGVGITKGLNAVLETGCQTSQNAIEKGLFFSPTPGLDVIDQLDPDFKKAYREVNGKEGDDIGILLWGLNKNLHKMFEQVGADLSRQSFISKIAMARIETNVYPTLQFSNANRFGASTVHLLKANCSTKQYSTEKTFASGF